MSDNRHPHIAILAISTLWRPTPAPILLAGPHCTAESNLGPPALFFSLCLHLSPCLVPRFPCASTSLVPARWAISRARGLVTTRPPHCSNPFMLRRCGALCRSAPRRSRLARSFGDPPFPRPAQLPLPRRSAHARTCIRAWHEPKVTPTPYAHVLCVCLSFFASTARMSLPTPPTSVRCAIAPPQPAIRPCRSCLLCLPCTPWAADATRSPAHPPPLAALRWRLFHPSAFAPPSWRHACPAPCPHANCFIDRVIASPCT